MYGLEMLRVLRSGNNPPIAKIARNGVMMVETQAHMELRLSAAMALLSGGCCAAACEVRCPISRFRVDVAGYQDGRPERAPWIERETMFPRQKNAQTIIVECKQSRADFLRDSRETPRLLARRQELDGARRCLEERIIRVAEPSLRLGGTSLFQEMETWEFDRSRLASYRKVMLELRYIDEALHGQTKFWMLTRYRLADRLYLAAPRGLIATDEVPPMWGLLEAELEDGVMCLRVRRAATDLGATDVRKQRLLRNIAAAASRPAIRQGALTAQQNAPAEGQGVVVQE